MEHRWDFGLFQRGSLKITFPKWTEIQGHSSLANTFKIGDCNEDQIYYMSWSIYSVMIPRESVDKSECIIVENKRMQRSITQVNGAVRPRWHFFF